MLAVLPPLPSWEGMHPLIVHFPIALLLITPLPALVALVRPKTRQTWAWATFLTLLLGTAAAFLALMSGEAAEHAIVETPTIEPVLERHEELAELARNLFAGLTAALLIFLGVVTVRGDRLHKRILPIGLIAFILLHAGASLVLINAAHEGGRLVHEFGVHGLGAAAASTD